MLMGMFHYPNNVLENGTGMKWAWLEVVVCSALCCFVVCLFCSLFLLALLIASVSGMSHEVSHYIAMIPSLKEACMSV